jgi:hypothetical protein
MQTMTARDVGLAPSKCPTTEAPGPYFQKEFFHNGYIKSLKQPVHFYNTRDVYRNSAVESGEHFGLVKYGTDPHNLNLTAKGHIRLNQSHPYTVFRVRLEDIEPGTTYYYSVDSMGATGKLDGVKSNVYHFTARE